MKNYAKDKAVQLRAYLTDSYKRQKQKHKQKNNKQLQIINMLLFVIG
jgi:hypothetical protein